MPDKYPADDCVSCGLPALMRFRKLCNACWCEWQASGLTYGFWLLTSQAKDKPLIIDKMRAKDSIGTMIVTGGSRYRGRDPFRLNGKGKR